MCRLLGYVARTPTTLPEFIGPSFSQFLELSHIHKDSWGYTYSNQQEMALAKNPETAALDQRFSETLSSHPTDGALLHFRWASPGLVVIPENAHPFTNQEISLIHNGAITPYDSLLPLVSPEFIKQRRGTTDSELYFLFLLTAIEERGFLAGVDHVLSTIRSQFKYSSINSMIMGPDHLVVISEHDPLNKPDWADEIYYELRFRVTEKGIAIASSGWDQQGWELMPNHSMLIIDRKTLKHELRTL